MHKKLSLHNARNIFYFHFTTFHLSILRNITSVTDDAVLIERFKSTGDINLLAELYQRYMDLAYAVALKYLKDAEASKDAVMEVFEELVVKLKRHEVTNFRSWLYTLVKNHCLMKLRSASRNKSVNLDENNMQLKEDLHQEVDEKEWQLQQMSDCIGKLAAEQKLTIELFYLQEKCYKEITQITGLEWNKVRSLIQNGRRNLKICMDKSILSASAK
jgi:RNA polymerase sigma-70 factor (ECF subfamily)